MGRQRDVRRGRLLARAALLALALFVGGCATSPSPGEPVVLPADGPVAADETVVLLADVLQVIATGLRLWQEGDQVRAAELLAYAQALLALALTLYDADG